MFAMVSFVVLNRGRSVAFFALANHVSGDRNAAFCGHANTETRRGPIFQFLGRVDCELLHDRGG